MAGNSSKPKKPFSVKVAIFCILLLAVVFFPSTILLGACMLPTYVAALTDNFRQKTAAVTVGAMNLVACFPAWLSLWKMGHQIDDAITLLMLPETMLYAYFGAAIGWLINFYVPLFISSVAAKKSERRINDIDKLCQELVRRWGKDVTGDK